MFNVPQYCRYPKCNVKQLAASEGTFILFICAIFFSVHHFELKKTFICSFLLLYRSRKDFTASDVFVLPFLLATKQFLLNITTVSLCLRVCFVRKRIRGFEVGRCTPQKRGDGTVLQTQDSEKTDMSYNLCHFVVFVDNLQLHVYSVGHFVVAFILISHARVNPYVAMNMFRH
jgi:hypothetical protein